MLKTHFVALRGALRGDALRGGERGDGQRAALYPRERDGQRPALRRPPSPNLLRALAPFQAYRHLFLQLGGAALDGALLLLLCT